MEKLEIDDNHGRKYTSGVRKISCIVVFAPSSFFEFDFPRPRSDEDEQSRRDYRSRLCLSWGLAAIIWFAVGGLACASVKPTLLLKINRSHLEARTAHVFTVQSYLPTWFALGKRPRTNQANLTRANNSVSQSLDPECETRITGRGRRINPRTH